MPKTTINNDQVLHDLKNPLSGITGSISLFLDGTLGKLSDEQQKYLANIALSAKKLTLLIEELQFINNQEKGNVELNKTTVNSSEISQALGWVVELAKKENKTIVLKIGQSLSWQSDQKVLLMVLADLLLSAVKQSPPQGTVTLEIKLAGKAYLFQISFTNEGPVPTKERMGFYACQLAVKALGSELKAETSQFSFRLP